MGWRDIKRVYFYIILGLGVLVIFLQVVQYIPVVIRGIVSPETAKEKYEHGRYGNWNWTPDGRIIYGKSLQQVEHTRGMGSMGYSNMGTVTQIRIMDADGNNDKLIKETYYQSARQKIMRRYREYKKKHFGFLPLEESDKINRESAEGVLDKIYLDPPLSHLGWIDWNAKNNKLVFVANDGTGKTGIAISDPEFKEVKWINYDGFWPKWSPDGKKIAFIKMTWKDGQPYEYGDIWLMDIEGKHLKQITNGYTFDSFNWFPSGKQFIVGHFPPYYKKDAYSGIGIVDINKGILEKMGDGHGLNPSISPDGQRIVCFSVDTTIMDINGNNKRTLYPYGGHFYPKWSPDGKKILMGWEGHIEVINPDGTGYKALTFKE